MSSGKIRQRNLVINTSNYRDGHHLFLHRKLSGWKPIKDVIDVSIESLCIKYFRCLVAMSFDTGKVEIIGPFIHVRDNESAISWKLNLQNSRGKRIGLLFV